MVVNDTGTVLTAHNVISGGGTISILFKFRAEFPIARVSYVIEKDLSALEQVLDHLFGDDPLGEQRRAYRSRCLGDQLGAHAADEFLRIAGRIVDGVK